MQSQETIANRVCESERTEIITITEGRGQASRTTSRFNDFLGLPVYVIFRIKAEDLCRKQPIFFYT